MIAIVKKPITPMLRLKSLMASRVLTIMIAIIFIPSVMSSWMPVLLLKSISCHLTSGHLIVTGRQTRSYQEMTKTPLMTSLQKKMVKRWLGVITFIYISFPLGVAVIMIIFRVTQIHIRRELIMRIPKSLIISLITM